MPALTDNSDQSGGTQITSYALEWNNGFGTSFTEVVGGPIGSDNLNRFINVSTTPGLTYLFRYRVRNIFGWSPNYSPTATILSASKPDVPASPTTEISGPNVRISWTQPNSNAAAIQAYTIEILAKDGLAWKQTLTCDGSSAVVISSLECFVPLLTLIDPAAFGLVVQDLVQARIAATNSVGTSGYSLPNTIGALVQTRPAAPQPVTRGAASSNLQLELVWLPLTTFVQTGGVSILSYELDWDNGLNQNVWNPLVGYSSAFTGLSYITTDVTAGTTYSFKLRAQNVHGWSDWSTVTTLLAASVPAKMTIVTVT